MPGISDFMDYDHWPGPSQVEVDWSVIVGVGRAYGKAFVQVAETISQSFHAMARAYDITVPVELLPDTRSPIERAIDEKNKKAHQDSKVRMYDHRGRRRH